MEYSRSNKRLCIATTSVYLTMCNVYGFNNMYILST